MKIYEIAWVKNYFATGSELISADSEEEALQVARDNMGDYEGSMEYTPEENWVESWGEIKVVE